MSMLMDRGTIDGRRFLAARTIDEMLARNWKSDGESNGEPSFGSQKDLFHAWGLGNQQFLDVSGPASGDRLVEGGGFTAIGHLGDAYGLHGAFVMNPETREGIIYLAGGTGFDPDTDPGQYSAFHRYEERILNSVYGRAIRGREN
jgi:hypothetical protein